LLWFWDGTLQTIWSSAKCLAFTGVSEYTWNVCKTMQASVLQLSRKPTTSTAPVVKGAPFLNCPMCQGRALSQLPQLSRETTLSTAPVVKGAHSLNCPSCQGNPHFQLPQLSRETTLSTAQLSREPTLSTTPVVKGNNSLNCPSC
jgi:hypothetical protein